MGGRCSCLRDSLDEASAHRPSHAREIGNMPVPFAGTHPEGRAGDVEIRLNQHGCSRGRWLRRFEKDSCRACHGQNHAGYSTKALTRTRVEHYAGRDERVDGNQHKTDAVNAGPRCELIDECVVHLRVAKLVPWHRGYAGGSQFKPGPENRSRHQRQAHAAGGPAQQRNGHAKEPEVKPQHQAEADQQQRGSQRRHIAVLHHHVANPVAIARIPQHAANVGEQKGAAQRTGLAGPSRRKDCAQQRRQSEPGKDRSPDRQGSGQWKRQFEQASR
jgi:hypothetical protein